MTLYRCYKQKKDLDKDVEQRGQEEFDNQNDGNDNAEDKRNNKK